MEEYGCHDLIDKFEEDEASLDEKEKESLELCQKLNAEVDELDKKLEESGAYDNFNMDGFEDDEEGLGEGEDEDMGEDDMGEDFDFEEEEEEK